LTYGQKTAQYVSYMTSWDETVLGRFRSGVGLGIDH